MAKPDLVFLTPDNEEKVRARLAPHERARIETEEKLAKEKDARLKDVIERIQQDALEQSKRPSN